MQVDHIDGNGLNNQRNNLRIVTNQQNGMNQKKQRRSTTSRYKGVCWHNKNKGWMAGIKHNRKTIYLGCYETEEEAALAYNTEATRIFGEYAKLNVTDNPPDIQQCAS